MRQLEVEQGLRAPSPPMPDGRIRLLCAGTPGGGTGWPVGLYLAEYDPDGADGRGSAFWTHDRDGALAFDSAEEAMLCYGAQPKTQPLRADGKPNRPLTAYTIEFDQT